MSKRTYAEARAEYKCYDCGDKAEVVAKLWLKPRVRTRCRKCLDKRAAESHRRWTRKREEVTGGPPDTR